jgi:CrcB protein
MGVIAEVGAQSAQLPLELKTFLTTGILGGFTTFSAFSLDTALLIERGDMMSAALYVSGSVLGSIAALFAGLWAVRMVVA